jgi:hypothetical protein
MGYAASIGFKSMQGHQRELFPEAQSSDATVIKEITRKT